jgi:hypothetical protein
MTNFCSPRFAKLSFSFSFILVVVTRTTLSEKSKSFRASETSLKLALVLGLIALHSKDTILSCISKTASTSFSVLPCPLL